MRIQFKDAPAADFLFAGSPTPRNELGALPSASRPACPPMSQFSHRLSSVC